MVGEKLQCFFPSLVTQTLRGLDSFNTSDYELTATRFPPPAQGCRDSGYPGKEFQIVSNRKAVVSLPNVTLIPVDPMPR
jgi:hypothetical protein